MSTCTNLILIHYSSFRDTANAAFKDHLKAKKLIHCSVPRETFPTFNYFIALIFSIFTVFQCEPEKVKGDRAIAQERGWRRCIVQMWTWFSLCQVFLASLLKCLCPRTRGVTARGKQDYTILSCPINYPPVWENKLSPSPFGIALEDFTLADGRGVSNPTLEKSENLSANSNLV